MPDGVNGCQTVYMGTVPYDTVNRPAMPRQSFRTPIYIYIYYILNYTAGSLYPSFDEPNGQTRTLVLFLLKSSRQARRRHAGTINTGLKAIMCQTAVATDVGQQCSVQGTACTGTVWHVRVLYGHVRVLHGIGPVLHVMARSDLAMIGSD